MKDDIIRLVKAAPHTFTQKDLVAKFIRKFPQINGDIVNGIITRAGLRDFIKKERTPTRSLTEKEQAMARKTKQQLSQETLLESRLRAETRGRQEVDKKYKVLQDELNKKEQALADALQIVGHEPKIHKIATKSGTHEKGEGTVICLLSDVHCDEVVPKHKTNYLNEHNPDISKQRVSRFFELVLRMLRIERQETEVNTLILWLGGDFFTSSTMHDAPCAFPPIVASMFAQDMIVSGIQFLLEQEPNLKLHIVGSVGNHSRISGSDKPVNVAIEQGLSLEWFMYHSIKQYFARERNVTFQLEDAYQSYVEVYGKKLRFNHGHLGFRYNAGLGGVHGPLWKVITQNWDKQIEADYTFIGHYHMYTPASRARRYCVNGSTIGATPYGMNFGFEEPIQTFCLIHNRMGMVTQRPLFVGNT